MERIRTNSPFREAKWRGWIKNIGQDNKGKMVVTLIIPFEQRAEVLELINAYGMPLDIYIRLFGEPEPTEDEWQTHHES